MGLRPRPHHPRDAKDTMSNDQPDTAEARLDRVNALLDQVQRVQGYQVIAVDRVRRALGEKTP